MGKGSVPRSATKENPAGSDQTKERKKVKTRYTGFRLVLSYHRDRFFPFTHPPCGIQTNTIVDHEALERGIVVARCCRCHDFVVLADAPYLFGDGKPETVKKILPALKLSIVEDPTYFLPTTGDYSFCVVFRSASDPIRVKMPTGLPELISNLQAVTLHSSTGTDVKAQSGTSGGRNLEVQPRTKGGSNTKEESVTNGGSQPNAQSATNGVHEPKEEHKKKRSKKKKKKSHETADQAAGENNISGSFTSELNPDFVLVQNGGTNPGVQAEMIGGSNPKEQSGMNGRSISKAQPGTNGGTNPEIQPEANGECDIGEEKNKKSKKNKKKKSNGMTDQSASDNKTNASSSPEFNPEFVLVQDGGSNHRTRTEMNHGSNRREQSRTTGGSISKAPPAIGRGSNPIAQLGEPKEKQNIENSKKKKSQEITCQSAGENKNRNPSSSPALSPKLVLVPNSIRDDTVEITHSSCDVKFGRQVNMEACRRGVVVVRCGGCDDLVAVVDHANLFGKDREHEKVEMFLGFVGADVPKGSDKSFCGTFESEHPSKTNGLVQAVFAKAGLMEKSTAALDVKLILERKEEERKTGEVGET